MLKRTFSLTIVTILAVACFIKAGTTISAASTEVAPVLPRSEATSTEASPDLSSSEEASTEDPPDLLSIHQKASLCWDNYDLQFEDDPYDCEYVCATCHIYDTPVIGGADNPGAYATDEIYLQHQDEETNWDSLDELQQSCRNCHTDISEAEPGLNHTIFVEYDTEETNLKLFENMILCTTCHSPHQDEVALLRMANHGSALCRDCHSN